MIQGQRSDRGIGDGAVGEAVLHIELKFKARGRTGV